MPRRVADPPVTVTVAELRQRLRVRASELGVSVAFGDGRRQTDATFVVVRGSRLGVLGATAKLFDGLGLDVEAVRSAATPEAFEAVFALMRPKRERRTIERERRASQRGGEQD